MAGWLKWFAAGALAAAASVGAQHALSRVPPPVVDVNMLFVPPPEMTKAMASGFDNVMADGLWLGLIQYYGDRIVQDDKRAVNLDAMLGLITDLDPKFYFAYFLGSWALADNGQVDAAVALLEKGAAAHRGEASEYQYPYLQGYMHFLYRRDYMAAARSFERTLRLPNAPANTRGFIARMYQTSGQDELALGVWRAMHASATDATTREIARKNIARVEAEMAGLKKRSFRPPPKKIKLTP